jgi:hypothetical protein
MPTGWTDIIDTNPGTGALLGSPGNWQPRQPLVLLTIPQLAQTYLQRINMAKTSAGTPPVEAQLNQYDAAECLYLIVKLACEDESNALGSSMKEVGDADGDGLPEFQDAFVATDQRYPTTAAANSPIMWNRWPAGFTNHNQQSGGVLADTIRVSDFQDDPLNLVVEASGNSVNGQTSTKLSILVDPTTFAADNHDYFDPLKLDMPFTPSGGSLQLRGFQLTPLIYSAGIDGAYGLGYPTAWNDNSYSLAQQQQRIDDPYATDNAGHQNSTWHDAGGFTMYDGVIDNITNHLSGAR